MSNKMDKEGKQSLISLVTSLMTMLLNICIGFFISPIVVRDLGVEANGYTQLANNFVSYASLLTIAINAMAGRFTTVEYYRGNKQKAQKYYTSALIGNIFVILILLLPAILLIVDLPKVLTIQTARVIDVQILFGLAFISFFCSNIQSTLNIATTVKNKQYLSNCLIMAGNGVRILILLILFRCFELRVFYVSLAAAIVSVLSILGYYGIKRAIMPDIVFNAKLFDMSVMKDMLASGAWSVVNKCGDLLMTGFDLLLTNILIGPIEMGILSVAKTVPTHLITLASTLSWNWNPKMTREYASGDISQMLDTIDLSAKVSILLVSVPTMAFCVFAPNFYSLWMPTQDANLLSVLSILSVMAYTMLSGTASVFNLFTITNNLKLNSITYCIGAGISILISIFCVKYTAFGLYAVAGVSSIITILRILVIMLPYAAKILRMKWFAFYKYVLLNIGCSIIVAAISFAVKALMPLTNWFYLFTACCVTGVVSVLFLSMLVLKREQRKTLFNRFIKKKEM